MKKKILILIVIIVLLVTIVISWKYFSNPDRYRKKAIDPRTTNETIIYMSD